MAVQLCLHQVSIESGGGVLEAARALLTKHRLHPKAGEVASRGHMLLEFPVVGSGHKGLYGSLKSGSQVGKMILEIIIENTSTIREDQLLQEHR